MEHKYGNLNNYTRFRGIFLIEHIYSLKTTRLIHANTDSVIECITQWYFKGIEMGIISKEKEA